MNCPLCKHGQTRNGLTSITLERNDSTVVFKQVPAEICENCGEVYHNEKITQSLLAQAEFAAPSGVEIDVQRYAVA